MPKVRKLIPGATVLVSSYFSILFATGLIVGYFITKCFYERVVEKERLRMKSILLNLGKRQIHLHHWLMGVLIFLFIWICGWLGSLPNFFVGAIFGLIFHDLYFDDDWYKVVLKKQKIKGP